MLEIISTTPCKYSLNISEHLINIKYALYVRDRLFELQKRPIFVTQFPKLYLSITLACIYFLFSSACQHVYKKENHDFLNPVQTITRSHLAVFLQTSQISIRFDVFAHFTTQTLQDCSIFMDFCSVHRKITILQFLDLL